MGTPVSSIPAGVIRTAIEGLMSDSSPIIDQLRCQRFVVSDAGGEVGIKPSKATLAGAVSDNDALGIAEGQDAPVSDWSLEAHTFKVARLAHAGIITEGAKRAALGFQTNGIAQCMELSVQNVTAKINRQLRKVLVSTVLNESQAAGTAWSSTGSATPLKNMEDALRKIGGARPGVIAIIGDQQLSHLKFNSDFTSRSVNFESSGVGRSEVAAIIMSVLGIDRVIVGSNLYNSANPGQAMSLAYDFDGVAWIGYETDLVFVEQGEFNAEEGRDTLKEADVVVYSRRTYIGRGHKEMGCVITGVV